MEQNKLTRIVVTVLLLFLGIIVTSYVVKDKRNKQEFEKAVRESSRETEAKEAFDTFDYDKLEELSSEYFDELQAKVKGQVITAEDLEDIDPFESSIKVEVQEQDSELSCKLPVNTPLVLAQVFEYLEYPEDTNILIQDVEVKYMDLRILKLEVSTESEQLHIVWDCNEDRFIITKEEV